MVSMQMMHCNVDSFTGLLACSFCASIVAIRCCSRTLERPVSSSTSTRSTSSILYARLLDWEAPVFLLLAGFDGADDEFLDMREGGRRRWEFAGGIVGGDESAVRSTKSLRYSVSGHGVSSRSGLEKPDDEDQKSSVTNLVGGWGAREGGVAWRGGGGGGRPDVLDASPTGLA